MENTSDGSARCAAGSQHMGDLELAENLMHTCYEMYRQTPTGLAPEIVFFLGGEKDFPKGHRVCCIELDISGPVQLRRRSLCTL
jgi:Glycosyl hydrolase family 47